MPAFYDVEVDPRDSIQSVSSGRRLKAVIKLVSLAILGVVVWVGCADRRTKDAAAIKKTYTDFRNALLRQDFYSATNHVSSKYLARHVNPHENIAEHFPITQMDMQLDEASWVRFDRKDKKKAILFLRRPPTVGYRFVEEGNGWKITVNVVPIVD